MLFQGLFSLITAITFFIYAVGVEVGKKCYYSEVLDAISPVDPYGKLVDVSHNFNVVIVGMTVSCLLDVVFQILRFTEVLYKYESLVFIASILNFLVLIGFFIGIHVVRFDLAGRACSTNDSIFKNFALPERGLLLKAYVIAAWTGFGLICLGSIGFAVYLKNRTA
jgi:hypothetical protein